MSLSATVQRLQNQENDTRAVAQDRAVFLAEWRSDVMRVFDQFEAALKQFVDAQAAILSRDGTTVAEEMLGEYPIQTLEIQIVGRRILLVPTARITVAGTGRLDLYRADRPAEDSRLLLVRGTMEVGFDPKSWLIESRKTDEIDAVRRFAVVIRGRRFYRQLDDTAIQDSIDYLLNLG